MCSRPCLPSLHPLLSDHFHCVRCMGDDACPISIRALLLAPRSPPYPHELCRQHRVFADRHPGTSRMNLKPLPGGIPGGVLTRHKPHETGDLLSAGKTTRILPRFQYETDGGIPPDPWNAPGKCEGLSVAEMTDRYSETERSTPGLIFNGSHKGQQETPFCSTGLLLRRKPRCRGIRETCGSGVLTISFWSAMSVLLA